MGRLVDVDDLVDAHDVADLLGLAQTTSVHLYQRRYPDMPRPVLDRGGRRARLWLRTEIMAWDRSRSRDRT
jgi:glutathione-regulated potassium-efflux system ancillary protein KefG